MFEKRRLHESQEAKSGACGGLFYCLYAVLFNLAMRDNFKLENRSLMQVKKKVPILNILYQDLRSAKQNIEHSMTSLCSSPLRARASAVYGLQYSPISPPTKSG